MTMRQSHKLSYDIFLPYCTNITYNGSHVVPKTTQQTEKYVCVFMCTNCKLYKWDAGTTALMHHWCTGCSETLDALMLWMLWSFGCSGCWVNPASLRLVSAALATWWMAQHLFNKPAMWCHLCKRQWWISIGLKVHVMSCIAKQSVWGCVAHKSVSCTIHIVNSVQFIQFYCRPIDLNMLY